MSTESQASDELRVAIDNYRYSVTSYYEFLSVIHPVLDELPAKDAQHVEERTKGIFADFVNDASEDELQELAGLAKSFVEVARRAEVKAENDDAPPEVSASVAKAPLSMPERKVSPRVGHVLMRLAKAMRAHVPAAAHRDILYRGVLSGLVGQFEVIVSDLAHHFYRRAPGSLGGPDKVLSVGELLSFGSIEDATDYVITEKVDDLLRGSVEDWRKFFESRLKIDLETVAPDWKRFVEYVQRRHLIVHAGSRLSRRYLKNVDPELLKEYFGKPEVGQPVRLSAPYIDAALSSFEATGLLLGFTCWAKLHRDHGDAQTSLLDDYIYEMMLAGRWNVVLHLASWGASQESFDASSRVTFQFNSWLALKRLGRLAECRKAIESFDTSALRPIFAVAWAALLNDADRFFELVERHKGAELDDRAWNQWPLFQELRADQRFEEFRKRFAPSKKDDSSNSPAGLKLVDDSSTLSKVDTDIEKDRPGSDGEASEGKTSGPTA